LGNQWGRWNGLNSFGYDDILGKGFVLISAVAEDFDLD
jgi:hypothetical protein